MVVSEDGEVLSFRRREWYCRAHAYLRGTYYNYVDCFGRAELERQASVMHAKLREIQCQGVAADGSERKHGQTKKERARLKLQQQRQQKLDSSEQGRSKDTGEKKAQDKASGGDRKILYHRHPNWRDAKILARHIQRVKTRAKDVSSGTAVVTSVEGMRPPCRCCGKDLCDGRCWGFWKSPDSTKS